MKTYKLFLAVALAFGLMLGFAGIASAANITCGDCHSAPPSSTDGCTGTDANGLHGVHVNYSSTTFPKTVANYGKCAYCHTSTTATAPTATHNNSYVNVTGVDSGGLATNLDFNTGSSTCANSCHRNEGAGATWDSYSTVDIVLSCNSCHDDSGASVMSLSGAHAGHFGSTIDLSGIAGAVNLNAGNNTTCVNCHPDNTSDGTPVTVDDGTDKVFTHASDGTNVAEDNAAISLVAGTDTRGSGTADSCANVCHDNKAVTWGASMSCDMCHDNAIDGGTALGGAHAAHFTGVAGVACTDCHANTTDTSHASALPVAAGNAAITRASLTFNDGANPTCTFGTAGEGCHGDGNTSPGWYDPSLGCANCHNYPTVSGKDWADNTGHKSRFDSVTNRHLPATGYDKDNDTYVGMTNGADDCGLCHSGGTHNNDTLDLGPNGHQDCPGGGNFTWNGSNVSGSVVKCDNVDCHSGKTTPNWY